MKMYKKPSIECAENIRCTQMLCQSGPNVPPVTTPKTLEVTTETTNSNTGVW